MIKLSNGAIGLTKNEYRKWFWENFPTPQARLAEKKRLKALWAKKYRMENPVKIKETKRKHYLLNRDKIILRVNEYRKRITNE